MKLLLALSIPFIAMECFLRGFDVGRMVSKCNHDRPLGD